MAAAMSATTPSAELINLLASPVNTDVFAAGVACVGAGGAGGTLVPVVVGQGAVEFEPGAIVAAGITALL